MTKNFEDGFVLIEKWLRNKNALFIEQSLTQDKRLFKLNEIAIKQMKSLLKSSSIMKLKE